MPGRITGNGTVEDPIRTEGLDDLQPRFMVVSPKMKEGLEVLAERERCAKIVYAVLDEALADMKQPGLDIYYTFVDIANVIAARIREGT